MTTEAIEAEALAEVAENLAAAAGDVSVDFARGVVASAVRAFEPSDRERLITDLLAYHKAQGGWGALATAMGGNDIHNNGLVACRTAARVAKDEQAQGLITRLLALREVPRRQLRRDVRERLG